MSSRLVSSCLHRLRTEISSGSPGVKYAKVASRRSYARRRASVEDGTDGVTDGDRDDEDREDRDLRIFSKVSPPIRVGEGSLPVGNQTSAYGGMGMLSKA